MRRAMSANSWISVSVSGRRILASVLASSHDGRTGPFPREKVQIGSGTLRHTKRSLSATSHVVLLGSHPSGAIVSRSSVDRARVTILSFGVRKSSTFLPSASWRVAELAKAAITEVLPYFIRNPNGNGSAISKSASSSDPMPIDVDKNSDRPTGTVSRASSDSAAQSIARTCRKTPCGWISHSGSADSAFFERFGRSTPYFRRYRDSGSFASERF